MAAAFMAAAATEVIAERRALAGAERKGCRESLGANVRAPNRRRRYFHAGKCNMRAITVIPKKQGTARLDDIPEPPLSDGPILVETVAIGVCGTDFEIVEGAYGWAPPGNERLVLGHESLGRVVEAPTGSGFARGDRVVGIVRRPDPVPCSNCAVAEWDMCKNGQYTERGIKERHGFASERYRIHPEYLIKVAPSLGREAVLLEPTSVVAKAWEQIERIGARARWTPSRVLVTGAGPIGLLAALLGIQRGLEVHVLDQKSDGPKPEIVRALGARYHATSVEEAGRGADIVLECTGVAQLVFDVMRVTAPGGIVCLTGVSSGGRELAVDMGALNRSMVLENEVVFGSVNANRRHYEAAAQALARADHAWLARVVSRSVPLESFEQALTHQPDDVKVVIEACSGAPA
jgi:threonine dehydrogenase-like Zn-dependent dehydrogenase